MWSSPYSLSNDNIITMDKKELIEALSKIMDKRATDEEDWHKAADELLLEYINDPEIEKAYTDIPKWYA